MSEQSKKNQVFTDYAAFLGALLPQAVGFLFHDRRGRLFWHDGSSHLEELNEAYYATLHNLNRNPDANDEDGRVPLKDCTAYLIRVMGKKGRPLGALTALVKQDVGIMPYRTVSDRIKYAIRCLERELNLRARLTAANNRLDDRGAEFEFLKTLTDMGRTGNSCEESLGEILELAIDYLSLDGAIFVAPQHGLSISGGEQPLSVEEAQREIIAMELMVDEDMDDLSAKLGNRTVPDPLGGSCAWPILEDGKKVSGILILSRPSKMDVFSEHVASVAGFVASTLEHVMDRGFDSLTGLINWPGFEASLDEACKAVIETQSEDNTLLYMDVDQMHLVNDTFGRETGDKILRRFSEIIQKVLDGCVVTRVASDSFAALLTGVGMEDAEELGKQICSEFRSLDYASGNRKFRPSVSIGIATLIPDDTDMRGVLVPAQIACQAAKDRGRDRCEIYQNTDASIVRRMDELSLVGSVRSAIEGGRLELHAQPIVPLKQDSPVGHFEVLVRMLDANGEPLEPAQFMGAAERYQLMQELDRWVVHKAITMLAETGTDTNGRPLEFAINLSGQSLGNEQFLDFVRDEILNHNVEPERVCFEITETAAVANLKRAQLFVEEIKRIGCRFSLDDFGTGLSSFAYLKLFEVDKLKIDGSFVRDAVENEISLSMIKAIAEIARVMKISTVAEYVENQATLDLLRNIGIDWAQGYHVGKPRRLRELIGGDTVCDKFEFEEMDAGVITALREEIC